MILLNAVRCHTLYIKNGQIINVNVVQSLLEKKKNKLKAYRAAEEMSALRNHDSRRSETTDKCVASILSSQPPSLIPRRARRNLESALYIYIYIWTLDNLHFTIKRTKYLNYFSLCALNLFNTRV